MNLAIRTNRAQRTYHRTSSFIQLVESQRVVAGVFSPTVSQKIREQIAIIEESIHTARLLFIENSPLFRDDEVSKTVFLNAHYALTVLKDFGQYLSVEEIGPSAHGTLFMRYVGINCIVTLEIGNTTVGYVCQDSGQKYEAQSASFNDSDFWTVLCEIFISRF